MFKFKRIQFSEYRENKLLNPFGYNDFKSDLFTKKKEGVLKIYPFNSNETYTWDIKEYFGKLTFKPHHKEFKNKFIDFKNSVLSLLRRCGVLYFVTSLSTGQFHKEKEIKEVWCYRIILLENYVICERLSSELAYNTCLTLVPNTPDYHSVYCGPDGKIFGWDKI